MKQTPRGGNGDGCVTSNLHLCVPPLPAQPRPAGGAIATGKLARGKRPAEVTRPASLVIVGAVQALLQRAASAAQIVLALDLDGTLIPFAPTPQEARIDGEAAALLEELSALPDVTLAVVTGRPRDLVADLAQRFPRLSIAAEHGAWRYADGAWEAAIPAIPQLDEIEAQLGALAARYPGALVERKSCSVCLHWRRVAGESHEQIISAAEVIVDEWLETHSQLERLPVTEALEVRHRAAHKGTAVSWLRTRAPGAPIIALGDDITDEDMFVSLREGDVGILVAPEVRRSQAGLRLPSPAAVHRFLRWLIDARRDRPTLAPEELVVARPPRPPAEARLVVASNRLPAAPSADRKREVGGLVSALLPVLSETSGIWLGWSGAERDPGLRLRVDDGDAFTRAQFDYPPTWRQRFYAGFCNQALWPLLHGFPERVRYADDDWRCYLDANRAYAQLVSEAGGRDALVWVQDFHLMLVARDLRRIGHRGRIGFYLHVPFPPLDIFETMPWAAEVMAALLEYDRIGLQSSRWLENFLHCARGLLGAEGRGPREGPRARVPRRDRSGPLRRRGGHHAAVGRPRRLRGDARRAPADPRRGPARLLEGHPRAGSRRSRACSSATRRGAARSRSSRSRCRRAPRCRSTRSCARASRRSSGGSTARTARPTGCRSATSTAPMIKTRSRGSTASRPWAS